MKFNRITCRHIPSEEGNSQIVIRVTFKGKRETLYTGFTCDKAKWDNKREKVKNGSKVNGYDYNAINEQLKKQETYIDTYFNDCMFRTTLPSLTDLKERFNSTFKRNTNEMSNEFFFLFEKFIQEQSGQKGWNKSMKEAFIRLMTLIKEFKEDITFADLTIATMEGLKVHLSHTMYNETLIKRLSYFKQFISWAQGKKYKIHEEYFTYSPKLLKSKIAIKYLEKEEVDRIYKIPLEKFSSMDIVRDAFIFQCYTALRYSDIKALTHDNINLTSDGYEIDLVTEKDDDRVRYPLSKIAVEIYEKYRPYEYPNGVVFPIMSNQKYNKHLKDLGKIAELEGEWIGYQYRLNEKIIEKTPKSDLCSHTARRTFITLAAQTGVSLDLISQITSHSEVKSMKPYIAVTREGVRKVIEALNDM